MAKPKNTGLGRGLDAIFMDNSSDTSDQISVLRISEIEPKQDQPRKQFDAEALAQLADSIATHGLIQPIVVRASGDSGFYQIVAGERRWRAAKMAGLTEVPVRIMELEDVNAAEIALIENIQREDLNAIEEAKAYKALISDYSMTQEDISKRVGKSRSAIANTLRLLDLPDEVIKLVENNDLTSGHARALLGLNRRENIISAANTAVKKNLNVRAVEQLVKSLNRMSEAENNKPDNNPEKVDYIKELSRKMTSRLGRRVVIHNNGKAKKIEINYNGNDDLNYIIKLLCGDNIFDE